MINSDLLVHNKAILIPLAHKLLLTRLINRTRAPDRPLQRLRAARSTARPSAAQRRPAEAHARLRARRLITRERVAADRERQRRRAQVRLRAPGREHALLGRRSRGVRRRVDPRARFVRLAQRRRRRKVEPCAHSRPRRAFVRVVRGGRRAERIVRRRRGRVLLREDERRDRALGQLALPRPTDAERVPVSRIDAAHGARVRPRVLVPEPWAGRGRE